MRGADQQAANPEEIDIPMGNGQKERNTKKITSGDDPEVVTGLPVASHSFMPIFFRVGNSSHPDIVSRRNTTSRPVGPNPKTVVPNAEVGPDGGPVRTDPLPVFLTGGPFVPNASLRKIIGPTCPSRSASPRPGRHPRTSHFEVHESSQPDPRCAWVRSARPPTCVVRTRWGFERLRAE